MSKMPVFNLVLALCFFGFQTAVAVRDMDNKTDGAGKSARFNNPEYAENRLPLAVNQDDKFHDQFGPYSDRQGSYINEKKQPYEIPSGFHDFVPDKSNGFKYTGNFYLPYPPNIVPDNSLQKINERIEMTTRPSITETIPSKIGDFFRRAMQFFFGVNDPDSVLIDEKPSLLTVFKQIFKDPIVALPAIIIPLSFVIINIISFMTKMLTGNSVLSNLVPSIAPVITSTIANTVARGLDSAAAEQILEVIGEFGPKAVEDPKCLQRLFCQAAKSHIESRSGDSWSAQKIVRKLVKAVDENLWRAFGLNLLYTSLNNGHCDIIPCSFNFKSSSGVTLMEKLRILLSNFFNTTETEHM